MERKSTGRDPDAALRRETTEKLSTGEVATCLVRATNARLLPRRGGGDRSRASSPSSRSIRWHRTTGAAVELAILGGVVVELVCAAKASGVVAVRPEDESVDIEVGEVSIRSRDYG